MDKINIILSNMQHHTVADTELETQRSTSKKADSKHKLDRLTDKYEYFCAYCCLIGDALDAMEIEAKRLRASRRYETSSLLMAKHSLVSSEYRHAHDERERYAGKIKKYLKDKGIDYGSVNKAIEDTVAAVAYDHSDGYKKWFCKWNVGESGGAKLWGFRDKN